MTATQWLKLAGVLAGLAASALGSYSAAKSNARTEAAVRYEVLRESVRHLEETQRMIWAVVMKAPAGLTKSMDGPAELLPLPFPAMRPLPDFTTVQARK